MIRHVLHQEGRLCLQKGFGISSMKFTKMQGCGNDYVYIDATKTVPEDASNLAIRVSDRHYGIGSDGLIMICSSKTADFRMVMFNADGSESEMCGNGIRCFGKFVYDHGLTDKKQLAVETLAGIKYLTLIEENGTITGVTVDMGIPVTKPEEIPVIAEGNPVLHYPISVQGKEYRISCASMGNPHAAVYVEDTACLDLESIGPEFENHNVFPRRVNTEFVQVIDRKHIRMRVWERGSGETWACGTGACACAYVSMLNGFVDYEVEVEMRGGSVVVRYDEADGHIYMTGPAVTTFEGEM